MMVGVPIVCYGASLVSHEKKRRVVWKSALSAYKTIDDLCPQICRFILDAVAAADCQEGTGKMDTLHSHTHTALRSYGHMVKIGVGEGGWQWAVTWDARDEQRGGKHSRNASRQAERKCWCGRQRVWEWVYVRERDDGHSTGEICSHHKGKIEECLGGNSSILLSLSPPPLALFSHLSSFP